MDLRPLLRPVGPLPAAAYWWRRLVALVAVLVVVLLVAWGCSGNGGGERMASTGSPAPTATPSATASRGGSTPSRSPAPVGACPAERVEVTALTDADSYPAGVLPHFTLVVRNTGTATCRVDLGAGARELYVYSGGDRVWSQDDCSTDRTSGPAVLGAGERRLFGLVWGRRRSAPSCPSARPAALPGTYRLYGRLGDLRSGPAVFHLTG